MEKRESYAATCEWDEGAAEQNRRRSALVTLASENACGEARDATGAPILIRPRAARSHGAGEPGGHHVRCVGQPPKLSEAQQPRMAALTALVLNAVAVAQVRIRLPIEHGPLPLLLLCRCLEAAQRAVAANVLCHRGRRCTADGARGMLQLPHFECERVDPPLRLHDDYFGWQWRLRR